MYFIPKYQRYSVGTRKKRISAQKCGAGSADMNPTEPPEFLHRCNFDEFNVGGTALLNKRFAEDGVGIGGHIGGSYTPGLQRFAKLLRTDHLSVACQPFRHPDTSMENTRRQTHANMDYSRNHEVRQQKNAQKENNFFIFP
jgi:hypothetical protein